MSAARVALVCHTPWLGGAERCALELAEGLTSAGREVHALVPGAARGGLSEALRAAGATAHDVPARWWAREPGAPWRAPDLAGTALTARALCSLRPDVVVSGSLVHPPGALAAGVLRVPHVWWVQEFATRDHGYRLPFGERGTLRLVGALSARVVVPSQAVRAFAAARGVPDPRLRVVAPAPGLPAASRPRSGGGVLGGAGRPVRLVLAGRVRPSKGHWDAVRAVGLLRAAGTEAVLDVVGDGALAELRAHAAALGVLDAVTLHGGDEAVTRFLDAADVALTPAHAEAFGRVTVEAQLRGLPVVGAASAGTAELLADGRGLLHPPGDAEGLAGAVARLAAEPVLRAAVARAGWDHARAAFAPARMLAAWLEVLDELPAHGARPRPGRTDATCRSQATPTRVGSPGRAA